MLTQGEGLDDITHVIVDEIHERDRFADFLLILLRDLLPAHPNLRVVLMSATLHIELFSSYFGGCPVIEVGHSSCPMTKHLRCSFVNAVWVRECLQATLLKVTRRYACKSALIVVAWYVQVPGFTYPVTDMYLEDVLRLIGYQDALLGDSARRIHLSAQRPAQSKTEEQTQIPKEQREAIESAIMQAFLHGSDEHFDHLLDVSNYTHPYRMLIAMLSCLNSLVSLAGCVCTCVIACFHMQMTGANSMDGASSSACLNVAHTSTGIAIFDCCCDDGMTHWVPQALF